MAPARKIFIAGSTGAVGQVVVRQADEAKLDIVPHLRPKPGRTTSDPRAAVLELSDAGALARAMRGCTTVVQLIGTIRNRFAQGDTYESSDIGTTQQLVDAAKGVGVDHVILLSSVGAGRPIGAYLKAKKRAEQIVQNSGIPWTLFRPSALTDAPGRHAPKIFDTLTRAFGLAAVRPIPVPDLSRGMLAAALRRDPLGAVLEGRLLFEWCAGATLRS